MTALNTDGKIPKKGKLDIDYKSPTTEEQYKGEFTVRRKTLEDEGKISQMLCTLTNGSEIVEGTMRVKLTAIATLSIVVEEYPDWWKEVEEVPCLSTITHVFDQYCRWLVRPFRKEQ
jgi:hypothetical protein